MCRKLQWYLIVCGAGAQRCSNNHICPPPARSPLPFPLEASAVSGHTLALLLDTVQWSLQCPVLQITTISNGKGIKYSSSILP
ncbi:hypothetical protein CEXT_717161 [Caerostris extrusa]|uniref:Secreted protein n=1 Tax=Caerostris extrusa TaxID=172846 RepID=A0AAV4P004_CAEEX|nr:hypothetical protein CEXT_717161 [Caerostris extrusa]